MALEELGVPILGQHLLEELLLERAVGDLGPLELAFVELPVGIEVVPCACLSVSWPSAQARWRVGPKEKEREREREKREREREKKERETKKTRERGRKRKRKRKRKLQIN